MPTHEAREPYRNMTRSVEAVVDPFAGLQRGTFGEWLRVVSASTSVLLQFQRAGLEASLRVADAIGEANRQVLDAWLGTAQQTHRALRETGEMWSSQAERVADRVTREAERVAEAADAAARQHERDMQHEQDRAEHEHEGAEHGRDRQHRDAERAAREQREHEPRQRESAERPTINVLKREDDWAVVRESASRASGVFETKREAVERARELAERDDAEVHIGPAADAGRTNGQRSGQEQKPARGAKGAKR